MSPLCSPCPRRVPGASPVSPWCPHGVPAMSPRVPAVSPLCPLCVPGASSVSPPCPCVAPTVSPWCPRHVPAVSPLCPRCVPAVSPVPTPCPRGLPGVFPVCPRGVPAVSPLCPLCVPAVSPPCPLCVPGASPVSPQSPSLLSAPAGYIPMNQPGLGCARQAGGSRPLRRSRQESVGRTVSESSEGRGTASELELGEGASLAGSLCRSLRSRGDSAYLSQRESFPPPPPGSEGSEEDPNGYVTPNCALRDTDPAGVSAPEPEEEEEYEYMNRRPGGAPGAPQPRPASLEELGYEYMEVGSEAGGPPGAPQNRQAVHDDDDDEEEEEEEEDYEYMNKQPRLSRSLATEPGAARHDGYTDMRAGDPAGTPPQEEQGYEEMEAVLRPRCPGCRSPPAPGMKPLRSLEASDCAFDNPDYWHSRLFAKADAQRT